jgi:maltose alpha-D-glucosyltransferase/alpha-amylase
MRQLYGLPYVEGAYKPRAGNRTPMQWDQTNNLGFSQADPEKLYLPVDDAPDAPTVKAQESDPNSLLNRVRKLIEIKKTEKALLAYAEFVPVYAKEKTYPFIYARANADEIILCMFNPADRSEKAEFILNIASKKLEHLAGDELVIINKKHTYSVEMPAISYGIYKLKNKQDKSN